MPAETIIITAPAGTRRRWIGMSRQRGQRLSDWIIAHVEHGVTAPPNATATTPCPRCGSVVLTPDGPGAWQCAQCGLAS